MERLFATEKFGGRAVYKFHAVTVLVGICLVLYYRVTHVPGAGAGRAAWLGMLAAELWFGFYWVITQSVRWSPIRRRTFKDRLAARYGERLPCVDIFVCTADPKSEPPSLVIATVLSVMAYNYPSEKLSVYLSDDGGSILTFYALWEASTFAKHWLPFCRKYNIQPRSPVLHTVESPSFILEVPIDHLDLENSKLFPNSAPNSAFLSMIQLIFMLYNNQCGLKELTVYLLFCIRARHVISRATCLVDS